MSKTAETARNVPRDRDEEQRPAPIPIKVRNPRYAGATMEDVARVLSRCARHPAAVVFARASR